MKRFVTLVVLILGVLILGGCNSTDKILEDAYHKLNIPGDLTKVTDDLELVTKIGDVEISWESKNEGVILPDGKVTRRDGDRIVVLIATLKYKSKIKTKIFEVTVLAKEALIEYTINYYLNGGTLNNAIYKFTKEDLPLTLPLPTYEGFEFLGWFLTSDFSGKPISQISEEKNITVHAKWQKKSTSEERTVEEYIELYRNWLQQNYFNFDYVLENITLPQNHPDFIDEILWVSSNPNIIETDGSVARPEFNQEVSLIAHIRVAGYQFSLDFTVTVLGLYEGNTETISELRKKPIGTQVEAVGVVTEISSDGIFIQDHTAAIHIYVRAESEYLDLVSEGNLIKVIGKINIFHNLIQISDISKIEIIKEIVQIPQDITITSFEKNVLSPLESQKVSFNGAIFQTLPVLTPNDDNKIRISLNGVPLNLFIKKHIDSEVIEELNKKLSYYRVGDEVSIRGVMVGIYDGEYQFIITEADNILDKNISLEEKYDAVKTELDYLFKLHNSQISRRIDFITRSLFGSEIFYDFSHPQILSIGVFNRQENDVTVSINIVIKIDGMLFTEEPIVVTVLANSNDPTPGELSEYYKEAEGKSGTDLLNELRKIISRNVKSIGYSSTNEVIIKSDVHPENNNVLLLIYNRETVSKNGSWNKEHVWPRSKLGHASKSDIHNLRAANPSVNSSRGNYKFVDGSGDYRRVGSGWYPGDDDKGDVARIVLYMHVRWGLQIKTNEIGDINMFIRWHYEDPVDEFEIHRNEIIFQYQRNRNPFIDYPDFVELIWSDMTQRLALEYNIVNNDIIITIKPTKLLFELTKTRSLGFDIPIQTPVYALINRREKIELV